MKRRLLAVQGPLQYIAGYTAMEWFGQLESHPNQYQSVLLMYDFLIPEKLEAEFSDTIVQLSSSQHWHKVVFIGSAEMTDMMKGKYSGCIEKLRIALGEPDFDEVYLARDFCGDGSPLIINAYPDAVKVAYGDSLGLVGDKRTYTSINWNTPVRSLLSRCKALFQRTLLGGPKSIIFDAAVLSLPLDLSDGALKDVPMFVPSKCHVERQVNEIYERLDDLKRYCNLLLGHESEANNYLFLLSNLSASGLMSQQNEISMYVEIIRSMAGQKDKILLKFHPRSSHDVVDAVVANLSQEYTLKVIDDVKLSRLPIELWNDLIVRSKIVAMFSTSALNIKYIYAKDVELPLDNVRIQKYFYGDKVAYVTQVNEMIAQSIAGLEDWDGKSVLWKTRQ
jgi:Alpha-2,8-polysialyltransferase (POLYST)